MRNGNAHGHVIRQETFYARFIKEKAAIGAVEVDLDTSEEASYARILGENAPPQDRDNRFARA